MLLLTFLTGGRYILSKLKHFTYLFIILKDYYLVGFGDVVLNIPYMVVKDTTVILPHGLPKFKP